MRKSIALSLMCALMCFGVALTSCQSNENNIIQSSDRNIESITLKEGTMPEVIVLGHFDEAGIKVVVTYSDGTSEEVAVNSNFLGDEYADIIQTVGTHQITILYRGERINITIKIVPNAYDVCFYAREGENAAYSLVKTETVGYKEAATAPDVQADVWDETKHYTFANWDADFSEVTKRLDVYAQYTSVNYYTVNFYDFREDLINTQKVDEGDNAVEPSEEQRHVAGYEFIGWDRTYLNVTKDINIYGLYQRATYSNVYYEVTPEVNGDTVKYGLYPQSLVEDQAIISVLENTEQHETGYYIYDEKFYAKVYIDELPSTKGVSGIEKYTIKNNYWFKVEPIEWTVVSQENGLYTLQSSYAIDARQFYSNNNDNRYLDNTTIYPNNYEYSDMRKFLNDDFFEKAFIINDSYIRTTLVDNSSSTTGYGIYSNPYKCSNTYDNVYLQNTLFPSVARKGMSDYCQCIVDLNGDSELYEREWSRSPKYDDKKSVVYFTDNHSDGNGCWVTDVYSIRPVITVAL